MHETKCHPVHLDGVALVPHPHVLNVVVVFVVFFFLPALVVQLVDDLRGLSHRMAQTVHLVEQVLDRGHHTWNVARRCFRGPQGEGDHHADHQQRQDAHFVGQQRLGGLLQHGHRQVRGRPLEKLLPLARQRPGGHDARRVAHHVGVAADQFVVVAAVELGGQPAGARVAHQCRAVRGQDQREHCAQAPVVPAESQDDGRHPHHLGDDVGGHQVQQPGQFGVHRLDIGEQHGPADGRVFAVVSPQLAVHQVVHDESAQRRHKGDAPILVQHVDPLDGGKGQQEAHQETAHQRQVPRFSLAGSRDAVHQFGHGHDLQDGAQRDHQHGAQGGRGLRSHKVGHQRAGHGPQDSPPHEQIMSSCPFAPAKKKIALIFFSEAAYVNA
jgi:hypothetical protein